MSNPSIHGAKVVPYSSIVGQSIMLLSETGACIGQLSVINCEKPQDIAKEVSAALITPRMHAYRVGVSVGRASEAARIEALEAELREAHEGKKAAEAKLAEELNGIGSRINAAIAAMEHAEDIARAALTKIKGDAE